MSTQLRRIEKQIERIKQDLLAIGPMRPGSITRQYRLPKEKKRPFYQISYTHMRRSHSEYVRPDNLQVLRQETKNFRKFRKLVDRWVALTLKQSQLRVVQGNRSPRQ